MIMSYPQFSPGQSGGHSCQIRVECQFSHDFILTPNIDFLMKGFSNIIIGHLGLHLLKNPHGRLSKPFGFRLSDYFGILITPSDWKRSINLFVNWLAFILISTSLHPLIDNKDGPS